MSKKVFVSIAVVVFLLVCEVQAAVIDSNWVGGSFGHWNDAINWSPSTVPENNGDTFAVTIDTNSTIILWDTDPWYTINQLDCNGIIELENRGFSWHELTILNGLFNYGELTLRCNIRGEVTNTPGAELGFYRHINIFGNLHNLAGATIEVQFEDVDVEDANIVNAGTIRGYDDGGIGEAKEFINSGLIELFGGHCHGNVFDNNSAGRVEGYGSVASDELFENKGTIYASSGALLVYSEGSLTNTGLIGNQVGSTLHVKGLEVDPNNLGTIKVNASGSVTFDCNLVNDSNGVIELLGGTLSATTITQSADANFSGFGGITGDVIIDPNGSIELTGPTNIVGDVTIDPNATLEVGDGITLVTGHTINNGTIHMKGGRLIPQGGITNNGAVIWEPGLYNNIADFNLDGQVNMADFGDFANTWLWQAKL